jgi:hypothetical protein
MSVTFARRAARCGLPVVGPEVRLRHNGVDVGPSLDPHWRAFFSAQVQEFDPDAILASTDDPAHLLLDIALAAPVHVSSSWRALRLPRRSVLTARALALNARRHCGVTRWWGERIRGAHLKWGRVDAVHVPIAVAAG